MLSLFLFRTLDGRRWWCVLLDEIAYYSRRYDVVIVCDIKFTLALLHQNPFRLAFRFLKTLLTFIFMLSRVILEFTIPFNANIT